MPRFPGRGGNGDDGGNGGGFPGGMIPMGMFGGGMPIILRENGPGYQQPQQGHSDSPPVRAILAMKYLQWLKDTQDKRPMPESVNRDGQQEFKIVDGQKPTTEEEATGVAAANVLEHYFTGKLKPNVWESADLSPSPIAELNCVCTPRDPITDRATAPSPDNCPFCSGKGKMRVVFDGAGTGQLLVQAAVKDEERPRHPELDAPATAPARSNKKLPPQT